jgi:hypothetical protein
VKVDFWGYVEKICQNQNGGFILSENIRNKWTCASDGFMIQMLQNGGTNQDGGFK